MRSEMAAPCSGLCGYDSSTELAVSKETSPALGLSNIPYRNGEDAPGSAPVMYEPSPSKNMDSPASMTKKLEKELRALLAKQDRRLEALEHQVFGVKPRSSDRQAARANLIPSEGKVPTVNPIGAKMFHQDQVTLIFDRPLRKAHKRAALAGGGVMGIMGIPFGPIGMFGFILLGLLCGALVGYCIDKRTAHNKQRESSFEKKRLKSLLRWAELEIKADIEDEEVIALIEHVTLEFKPISDIAAGSTNARKLLKLLDRWIGDKTVQRQLWTYMDQLLMHWRQLSRADVVKAMRVFQTLTEMYKHSRRVLDEQEEKFCDRMVRLLEHDSVKSVMAHAQLFPTQGAKRVMECMVYADHEESPAKPKAPVCASPKLGPPSHNGHDDDSEDELDDTVIESYAETKGDGEDVILAPGSPVKPKTPRAPVLKKAFFRNFEDFMDFDVTIKHKMPITLGEFDLLLQKETEPLKGWDVCVDRSDIKVVKIATESGVVNLRAWVTMPGVEMLVAFFLFFNFEERVKWDKVFAKMDLIDPDCQGSDILYSLMKVPTITPRDFLQYRRVKIQEDGSICILLRSAETPKMPEIKGYIRAESYISGYVLRQTMDGNTPVLQIFLMACSDVKGMIPKSITNYFAPRKTGDWVNTLRAAATEYQQSGSGYRDAVLRELQKHKKQNPFDYEQIDDEGCQDGGGQAAGGSSLRRIDSDSKTQHTKITI